MSSNQDDSSSGMEVAAADVARYGITAYGVGYLLVILSVGLLTMELGASGIILTAAWLSGLLLFFAWISAALFAVQIIARAGRIQQDLKRLQVTSLPVTLFSLTILLLGMTGITLHDYVEMTEGIGSSVTLLFPSIISVASAIILIMGIQVYSRELTASKLIGGVFILVSIVLLYFVCLTPWRQIWYIMQANLTAPLAYFPSLPPLPGPLLCESNIETLTLLFSAICVFLIAIPTFRGEKRRAFSQIIVSLIAILFSSGLLYLNISTLLWMLALTSTPYSSLHLPSSIWIMLFGVLILSISGIIILIYGCLSIVCTAKERSQKLAASLKATDRKVCSHCNAQIPANARFCPNCGKETRQTSEQLMKEKPK